MGIETALAVGSLALGAIGTGGSAIGAANTGAAASQAANYQAQVAANNAKVEQWKAADALARGQVAEQQRRQKTAQQISSQRAALASSGTDVNTGSNVNILEDTAGAGEFDAITIRSNAQREAYGHEVAASNATAQQGLDESRASSAETAGLMGAGADLISGASSVSDKWLSYKDKVPSFATGAGIGPGTGYTY